MFLKALKKSTGKNIKWKENGFVYSICSLKFVLHFQSRLLDYKVERQLNHRIFTA